MQPPDRFSDLRVLRWFDRIDEIMEGEIRGPIRANIDLTNVCNHSCLWCEPLAYRESTMKDHNHTLKTEVGWDVLGELATLGCKTINFSGGGEPTCHPDFGQLLERATALQFRTWIVTNGQLMHKWFDELLLADHIRISLDASNSGEHFDMHGNTTGLQYLKVCENIEELCKRRVTGSPEVGISYLIADCNSSGASIQRIMEFAAKVNVDFIQFRPLSEEKPERFTGDWDAISREIEMMSGAVPNVHIWPLGKRLKDVFVQREFDTCYSAFTNAVIGADGNVQACCDRRDLRFGNVNEQSFKSIWLSAKHRQLADKIVPKLCTRCLQCSFNKSVERFIVNNEALPELV